MSRMIKAALKQALYMLVFILQLSQRIHVIAIKQGISKFQPKLDVLTSCLCVTLLTTYFVASHNL